MENSVLVSIGMPVYNGERFIRKALDSLLDQDYENFELIISDNASTDATEEICLDYVSIDTRIRYYRNEYNLGSVENFNRVFDLSSGKYFMWAGGHDGWAPTFISSCVVDLENDPQAVLCYSQTIYMDLEDNPLYIMPDRIDTRFLESAAERLKYVLQKLYWCNMIYGVIRSDVLRQTGLFRNVIGPDTVLIAELSLAGTFIQVAEPLYFRRMNPEDDVSGEARLIRMLKALDPVNANKKQQNIGRLYRNLTCEHLGVVARSLLTYWQKVKLSMVVIWRFGIRFDILPYSVVSVLRSIRVWFRERAL
ncbi:MAG: glycosyltransferase [Nitrospirota bacterium]|nr:glycosyltransferase [Nitrospirota bacterium]